MAAALPAALPAVAVADVAKDLAAAATREFLAWARSPFYANQRTTTRSWTEVDKNGKAHHLTETKTRGFSISNGTVLGLVGVACVWEVGTAFAKAVGGFNGNAVVKDATDILAAPFIIAYDAAGAIVGMAQTAWDAVANAAVATWDWLDGKGPVHGNSPPPTAVKTVAMPATAMAAHNQLLNALLAPAGAIGQAVSQRITSSVQNMGSGSS